MAKRNRTPQGNTLAMVAIGTIILLGVVIFILLYMSQLRSGTEHRTAIDSAALAAARDVSRIVVNTPEFGFVGWSTEPPIGSDTNAPDDWFQQVHSINELMATARLDLIIAQELNEPFMKNLAREDLQAVLRAKDALTTEITAAITSTGSAKDAAGNTITPYLSAERIYLKNQAKGSTYVPNSLRLTLGGVQGGIETNTQAPTPLSKGACFGNEANGKYLSERNIPFQGSDFVFGSVAKRVALCEKDKFRVSDGALPYQMPAVILAEATQQFTDQGKTWTVAYAACACCGSAEPERPAPGALTISFPDGPIPEITKAGDAWNWPTLAGAECDYYQAAGGDFIVDRAKGATLIPCGTAYSFYGLSLGADEMTKLALYDWLRCGGSNVNIDSIIALEALPMDLPVKTWTPWKALDPSNLPNLQILGDVPTGIMHIYTFNKDGTTKYVSKTIQPYPYTTVGENQLYGELRTDKGLPTKVKTSLPWKLSGVKFLDVVKNVIKTGEVEGEGKVDLYVRDLSRVLGNKQGGKHGGERLDGNPLVSYQREPILLRNIPIAMTSEFFPEYAADLAGEFPISSGEVVGTTGGGGQGAPALVSRQDDFASTTPFPPIPPPPFTVYSQGPAGGAPRPCYTKNGVAADIRFRRQVKVGDLAILLGGYKIGYIGEMLP